MRIETKEDVREFFSSLIKPLSGHFSQEKSLLTINAGGATYPQRVIGFEGFCRPLWGLVPYLAGGGEGMDGFVDTYLEGIRAGCDPQSPGFWGHCGESDQRFVEMGALAYALLAKPDIFWDRLEEGVKDRLSCWLVEINDHDMPHCNWLYFRVLVNLAMKRLGRRYSEQMIARDLREIESWYLGNGCYVDGSSLRLDYYVPFALHFYRMLIAILTGEGRQQAWQRASLFYDKYRYLFADTGEAVPYGRSQIYRFATTAFFGALAFFERDERRLGELKGYIFRNLSYWSETDMCTSDGILSVGYEYPNLTMAERYNSPVSPYWAFKAFVVLMLEDDHPFWAAEPVAASVPRPVEVYREGGIIMHNRGWDAVIYPTASRQKNDLGHFMEKYAKFAYSSAFPFSVMHSPFSLADAACDSSLVFEFPDGRVATRRVSRQFEILDDRIVSFWSPDERISVRTEIVPSGDGHIRRHTIKSSVAVKVYECGFAISSACGFETKEGEGFIELSNSGYRSCVEAVSRKGEPVCIKAAPNTNMKFRNTVIPALSFTIGAESETEVESVISTFRC